MLYFFIGLAAGLLAGVLWMRSKWKVAESALQQSSRAQEEAVAAERRIWETRLEGESSRAEAERNALENARAEAEKNFQARLQQQEEQHLRRMQELEEHCGERLRLQQRQFEESRAEAEKRQATRDALLQEQFKN